MKPRKRTPFEAYVARLMLDAKFRRAFEKERKAIMVRQERAKRKPRGRKGKV